MGLTSRNNEGISLEHYVPFNELCAMPGPAAKSIYDVWELHLEISKGPDPHGYKEVTRVLLNHVITRGQNLLKERSSKREQN